MAHVIQLRCERCGGPTDTKDAPWIRCPSCGSTAGFDFTSSLENPEMADFMRRNMEDPERYVKLWQDHEAGLQKAAALHRKSPEKALAKAADEADFIINETPWAIPTPAKSDKEKLKAYRLWLGFELLHARLPGKLPGMQLKLNEAAAAIGFGANENPLPAFRDMLTVLREMAEERARLGQPPDPEGLSLEGRIKLTASTMVAAYIRMVSPELQVNLLREIYGDDAIEVVDISGQDYSVYFDWECPKCGLFSPQVPQADKLTCPGCYVEKRVDSDVLAYAPIALMCHGCGSRVELGERVMDARCEFCTSRVKRFVRQGDAHREVIAEVKKREAAKHGFSYEEMMEESPGFGVTPENRLERLRDGLVRIAEWYNFALTPARYLGFARASLPEGYKGLLQQALAAAESNVAQGFGDKRGVELIRKATARAQPGP